MTIAHIVSSSVPRCPKMSLAALAPAPCPCAPWQWHGLLQPAPWRGRSPVRWLQAVRWKKNGGSGTSLAREKHLDGLIVFDIYSTLLCQLIRKTCVTIDELHELLAITTLINDISMGSFSTTNQLVPRGHDLWLQLDPIYNGPFQNPNRQEFTHNPGKNIPTIPT